MPIILATQKAEIRRIKARSQPRQIVFETLSWKYPTQKRSGGVVECSGGRLSAWVQTPVLYIITRQLILNQRCRWAVLPGNSHPSSKAMMCIYPCCRKCCLFSLLKRESWRFHGSDHAVMTSNYPWKGSNSLPLSTHHRPAQFSQAINLAGFLSLKLSLWFNWWGVFSI
jgi:hypothetical protein